MNIVGYEELSKQCWESEHTILILDNQLMVIHVLRHESLPWYDRVAQSSTKTL